MRVLSEASLRFLTTLELESSNLSSWGVRCLSQLQLRYLRHLNLSNNNKVRNAGLKALVQSTSLQRLESLKISQVGLSQDGMKLLLKSQWPNMTGIELGRCQVNSTVLRMFSELGLRELRYVYFNAEEFVYPGFEAKIKLRAVRDVVLQKVPVIGYKSDYYADYCLKNPLQRCLLNVNNRFHL